MDGVGQIIFVGADRGDFDAGFEFAVAAADAGGAINSISFLLAKSM